MINSFGDERLRKKKRFFCEIIRFEEHTDDPDSVVRGAYLAFDKKADRDAACTNQGEYWGKPADRAKILKALGRFAVIDGVCISQRKKNERLFYDDLIEGLKLKIYVLERMKKLEEMKAEQENFNTKEIQERYIKNLQDHLKQQEKDHENFIRNNYMH